ncbi:MAG TPA: APC family permease, partial [Solirubrobacteraceae bacterium]
MRHPVAGGAAAYVRAAYGRRAAAVTGWWFYAGVVAGAPAVWLIGGFYVAHLTGGGRPAAVAAAAAMMVVVVASNARGLHATARFQLGLAALLAVLLLVAVASALPSAHAANWTPFAPHGWLAIGTAANVLMLSFVGWEAVAHLAGDFSDPRRQLPRAMLASFAVVAVLYLGLAVTTVAVLGGAQGSTVPLADLMQRGLGGAGSALTARAAVLLTVGTTNAYVAGATRLARALAADGSMPRALARPGAPLAVIAAASVASLAGLAAGLVDVDPIVRAISTAFVAVYVAATAAGVRLLDGRLRATAALSLALVVVVLAFSGPYIAAPAGIALVALTFVSARAAAQLGAASSSLGSATPSTVSWPAPQSTTSRWPSATVVTVSSALPAWSTSEPEPSVTMSGVARRVASMRSSPAPLSMRT